MILFRAKKSSSHHSVHGIHGPQPKLAPIDVLQNVDDRKFISQNHQLMISKPEIAILCSTRNHQQQENDKKDNSNGSSSGYGSGLMTPDVAKTNPNQNTIPNSNSNYHLTNGGPNSRVNLVTIAQHQRGNYTYNNYNYDVYNDDHMNLSLPPPPPPQDDRESESYKNYDSNIFDNSNFCYTNQAMQLNQINQMNGPNYNQQLNQLNDWNELDVHKLMVQQAIVRYSPELNVNVNVNHNSSDLNNQNNHDQFNGLAGTQV